MIYEFHQARFTEGVLAKSLQGRSTEEFYNYGVKSAENMIPLMEGPMIKRPGTVYVSPAGNTTSRLFPFYKGGEEAYVVEVGYDTSASATTKTNCTSSGTPATTITLAGGQTTADLFVGQHVYGANVDATAGYPTNNLENSTQIATISSTTVFTLTNAVTSGLTSDTLNFSNKPFIRIYSQDKLLNVQGTTTSYVVKSHRWVIDPTATNPIDEIAQLNVTQSGDVLFFSCPTRTPFMLSRTLEPTNALRAEDNSVWTLSEYIAEDGPYQNTNADNDISFLISGSTVEEEIAAVTFDVSNNYIVVANHGLQTGEKINLSVADTTSDITGNTQIIVKNGTVDPTITTTVTASNPSSTILEFETEKSHGLQDNDIIQFGSTADPVDLPGGITAGTDYYVHTAQYYTFQVAPSEDGTAVVWTDAGADVFFGSNKETEYGEGDLLLGEHPNPPSPATPFSSNSGVDNHFYVVYSSSTSLQISDAPTNKSFDIGYRDRDSSVPPITGVQFTGKCTLKRVKHESGTDITITSRVNLSTGWTNASATNGGQTFSDADIGRMMRLNPLADTATRRGGIRWGWGKITARTNDYTITVKLETDLSTNPDTTNGTPEWRLGAFSGLTNYTTGVFDGTGYPKISQVYQQRFVFAATNYEPSTIWLSRSGNFYNYAPTELTQQDTPVITGGIASEVISDSNGLNFTIDSDTLDEIKWLVDSKKLAIGTTAGVYFLYGTETNLAVVPTRFTVSRETSYSASDVLPVIVSNVLIYAQRGGREIQELEFSGAEDQWLQSRISMKAYDMISTSSVVKLAWQERPNPIIWMIMENGQVLSLSYDRGVKFKAWSIHTLGGSYQGGIAKVVDIAIIPRIDYDQVWLKVRRTINSVDVDTIEIFDRFPSENVITRNELVFVDSAKIHKASEIVTGTATVNGLQEISALVNGGSQSGTALTVDGLTAVPSVGTKFTIAGDDTEYTIAASPASTITSLKISPTLAASPTNNALISIKTLTVDGATTAPPTGTTFYISTDPTLYTTLAGSTSTLWNLDQALVQNAADNVVLDVRLKILTVPHLEGESVGLCTNGMEHANKTVTSSVYHATTNPHVTSVTLNHSLASTAVSGLSYTAQMETLSPPTPDNQYNFLKRLLTLTALIQDSLGIEIEYNDTTEEILFRSTQQNTGEPIDFFNGFKKASLSGIGWETHNVVIRSTSPLPMQINSLSLEVETGGA